jgi:peptide/nickel transport system substrate-binding protein
MQRCAAWLRLLNLSNRLWSRLRVLLLALGAHRFQCAVVPVRLSLRFGLLSLCLVTTLEASCRPHARPAGVVVVLTESPVGRLDPRFAVGAWDVRVSRLIAPGLTIAGYAPGTAGLGDGFRFHDPRHVEVTLRADARFSSGRAVDAHDVAYTFRSILDPQTQSPYRSALSETLSAVNVLDPKTVVFELKVDRASFTADLQMGIVDRLFDAKSEKHGIEVVGAGPFSIKKISADRIELSPNAFAKSTTTAGIVVRTIRDDNARIIALLGKSGDAILNGITPQVLQALQARSDLRITTAPSATVTYLGFNLKDGILGIPEVRRAIASAIDRPQLVRARLGGNALLADSLLASDNPFHAKGLPDFSYDPARSRSLLDAAGFPDPDGDGPLPRFSLVWKSSNNRFRVSLAEAIAKQLGHVGIKVEVRAFDFATLMKDLRHLNYQLFSLQMTDVYEPDWLRSTYHSSRIPTEENGWSGLNRFGFVDDELDANLQKAAGLLDPAERLAMYAHVQQRVGSLLPCFPLWHENNVLVTRASLGVMAPPRSGGLEVLLKVQPGVCVRHRLPPGYCP